MLSAIACGVQVQTSRCGGAARMRSRLSGQAPSVCVGVADPPVGPLLGGAGNAATCGVGLPSEAAAGVAGGVAGGGVAGAVGGGVAAACGAGAGGTAGAVGGGTGVLRVTGGGS